MRWIHLALLQRSQFFLCIIYLCQLKKNSRITLVTILTKGKDNKISNKKRNSGTTVEGRVKQVPDSYIQISASGLLCAWKASLSLMGLHGVARFTCIELIAEMGPLSPVLYPFGLSKIALSIKVRIKPLICIVWEAFFKRWVINSLWMYAILSCNEWML